MSSSESPAARHDSHPSESDVPDDPALAGDRTTGGPDPDDGTTTRENPGDTTGTTGTAGDQEYVGRVAGDDVGYAGETGAERRAR